MEKICYILLPEMIQFLSWKKGLHRCSSSAKNSFILVLEIQIQTCYLFWRNRTRQSLKQGCSLVWGKLKDDLESQRSPFSFYNRITKRLHLFPERESTVAGNQKFLLVVVEKISLESAINGKNVAGNNFCLVQPESVEGFSKEKLVGKILLISNCLS